ncbi:MAG: hypothetical protein CVT67_06435 [Actinobacteria bacterium HGW-Actinobacteria-7]|nr:MAG: hypothetical protein CVT67_06435 [Actinobacteria bacterium HGW-Actinobacteria-7]
MKKMLLAVLTGAFVLGMASAAFAAPVTYQDLKDSAAKYSGGYAAEAAFSVGTYFDGSALVAGTATEGFGTNPHGGYSSTSNKCKVCHAVHRAEGAYYLLRGDSQSDACDYCHIGGGAHSDKIVYDLNPAGTDTTNGHTMGAFIVPDSATDQNATPVVVSGTDSTGNPITETVEVRSYNDEPVEMYRFSRHHSQSAVTNGRSGWKPVGPNSLSCFSCHQPHNAAAQVWQPASYDTALVADGAALTNGYKLLRRYPSGTWTKSTTAGTVNQPVYVDATTTSGTTKVTTQTAGLNEYGMIDSGLAVKVPETTLTAGFNYSQDGSGEKIYNENGAVTTQPTWIAQNMSAEYAGSGPSEDPATVNQYTLSVWCADCHNLNIGGAEALTNEELGFKAHTERTHPAPYVGSHSGPGQCYSCHRNDLSVEIAKADPTGYGMNQAATPASAMVGSSSCSQCHYGTSAYQADRNTRASDFPHSGSATDIKMLGSYTTSMTAGSTTGFNSYKSVNLTEDNLDAVCLRCHPGIGVHN